MGGTAALGKNLTLDNLTKCAIILEVCCCPCRYNSETEDHFLVHCTVARGLWAFISTMLGVQWVMPKRVIGDLFCWQSFCGKHRRNAVVKKCIITTQLKF